MILHVMSAFPPYSQTFVMREIRALREAGWDIRIGALRPVSPANAARGFPDLDPVVIQAGWLNVDFLRAFLFYLYHCPGRVRECVRLIVPASRQPLSCAKLMYILLASLRLAYHFRDSSIQLVRAHFLHSEAVAAYFLGLLLDAPYSITVYTTHVIFPDVIIRKVVQGARFLVADTAQAGLFVQNLCGDVRPIHRVPNSVELSEFPSRAASASGFPVILAVGRLDPKKGFHVLLDACAILRDHNVAFKAIVIGGGRELRRLNTQRKSLHLERHVEFLGVLSFAEVKTWLYQSAVLVMPSVVAPSGDTDGMPTVIVEAMASGLPVVATSTGAIAEAVVDQVSGFLVAPNDARKLAERISLLLSNERLRSQLGREARQLAVEHFDLHGKAKVLSQLFYRYINEERRQEITQHSVTQSTLV